MKNHSDDSNEIHEKKELITAPETDGSVDIKKLRAIMNPNDLLYTDDQIIQIYRFLDLLADLSISQILNKSHEKGDFDGKG